MVGAPLSLILFILPRGLTADHPLLVSTIHLSVLVLAATVLGHRLADHLERPFFETTRRPWLASAASIVALATGFAALVTLPSSAVLGYPPSLQFLQLLSSLDVAWSAVGLGVGIRFLTGSRSLGITTSLMLDAICVFSIWNYLRVVGFGPSGEWIVDGARLATLVIPFDVAAALMAVGSLLFASRRVDVQAHRGPIG